MKTFSKFLFRCLGILLGFVALNASAAVVRYVDVNSTNAISPYTSWATAATTIQNAINIAANGDLILVTNGVYQTGAVINSGSNRVNVFKSVTVQSVNGPGVTVIQGAQVPGTTNGSAAVRCVYLVDGATLSGFTLTNGATANFEYGGGVRCQSTNAVITNCVIAGNAAYSGGGGTYFGKLISCSLVGNASPGTGGWGGGANSGVLINCVVARNLAGYVGG